MNTTRRTFLKAGVGAAALSGFAGCLGDSSDVDGYTAFFSLWDWAENVAGDELTFEDPVGTGRMGHGWSPDSNLAPNVADAGLFIYLDAVEFSWAQDLVETLERDYGEDEIYVIDALDGLEPHFLPFDGGDGDGLPTPEYDHDFDSGSLNFDEFDIYDLREDDQLGYWHVEHWHGGVPDVPLNSFVPVGVVLEDTEGRVVPLAEDRTYWVGARVADDADNIVTIESRGDHVEIHGESEGESAIIFEIYEDGELVYDTSDEPEEFAVVEDAEEMEFFDPHLWADPVHAQRMVDNIAEGLAEYDSDNAETYHENAASYNEKLDEIDRKLQTLVANAELDVAIFAGHDSFQYIERRYGFELVTPVGVSPDAAESQDDILGLLDVIEANDIDTVLYDPFEAATPGEDYPQMVQTIFESSDVTDAEPLTPVEGVIQEWEENDWGWVEQMENVNIPSLEAALKVE